jgi:peptide-methionine (S)-S-oxide reductase
MKQRLLFFLILLSSILHCQTKQDKFAVAYFGSGCFWCVEAIFESVKGIEYAESGYSGGKVKNPSYNQICTGTTGHAETVKVVYDPKIISYDDLLGVFFNSHDPTTLNQQGPDKGTQYRSVIFYTSNEEKEKAKAYIQKLLTNKKFKSITTECTLFEKFYKAEDYHQNFERDNPDNPYVISVSKTRLNAFKKKHLNK